MKKLHRISIWAGGLVFVALLLFVFQNCSDALSNAFQQSNIENSVSAASGGGLIVGEPLNTKAYVGQTITLQVVTAAKTAAYQWYFNGQPMSGQVNSTLTLSAITAAQAGNYSVLVFTPGSSEQSRVAAVSVSAVPATGSLPVFDVLPQSANLSVGSAVVLSADASGYPLPTYQWYFNGAPISGQTGRVLFLNNVSSASSGMYYVSASNASGMNVSSAAQVTVN